MQSKQYANSTQNPQSPQALPRGWRLLIIKKKASPRDALTRNLVHRGQQHLGLKVTLLTV